MTKIKCCKNKIFTIELVTRKEIFYFYFLYFFELATSKQRDKELTIELVTRGKNRHLQLRVSNPKVKKEKFNL